MSAESRFELRSCSSPILRTGEALMQRRKAALVGDRRDVVTQGRHEAGIPRKIVAEDGRKAQEGGDDPTDRRSGLVGPVRPGFEGRIVEAQSFTAVVEP